MWDASPVISLGPHGLGLATRPRMSRAGSRLRRLESCTVPRPCPCERLNTGLLVKYPGPSWALSLVTHRQAQDAIQYSGEITGARRHHDAVLVCFSKPQHWVPATRQSTIMGAHTFADGLWINTKWRHPHRSFYQCMTNKSHNLHTRRSWWQAEKCRDGSNVLQQCTRWHCPCLGVQQVPSLYTAYSLHSWCRSKFRPIFAATLIGLQLHPDILGVKLPQPPQLSTVTAGHNFQLKFGMDPMGKVPDSSL